MDSENRVAIAEDSRKKIWLSGSLRDLLQFELPLEYALFFMNPEAEVLNRILAEPEEIAPRLEWAALQEANDAPRADLVRTQCARESDPEDAALIHRERELIGHHQARWMKEFRPIVVGGRFRRGFLEHAYVKMKPLLDAPAEILARTPLRSLYTRTLNNTVAKQVAAIDATKWIVAMTVTEGKLSDKGFAHLLSSTGLDALERLHCPHNAVGPDGIVHLAAWTGAERLTSVDLSANPVWNDDFAPLLSGEQFGRLAHLGLSRGVLPGLDGMVALTHHLALPNLTSLDIHANRLVGHDDFWPLRDCPTFSQLKALSVAANDIGPLGASVLNTCDLRGLESLDCGSDIAPRSALRELGKGEWPSLRTLRVGGVAIQSDDIEALVENLWPCLVDLQLTNISENAIRALTKSKLAAQITALEIHSAEASPTTFDPIFEGEWPRLRVLDMNAAPLTEHCALLLLENGCLPSVHTAYCSQSQLSSKTRRRIRNELGPIVIDVMKPNFRHLLELVRPGRAGLA